MIVITMTNCPPKLRGDLTKWLCEINTGVYAGQVNARVRDALWQRVCENAASGRATMVYSTNNEQHMEFRTHNSEWIIRDFDGIKLVMRPNSPTQIQSSNQNELKSGFSRASQQRMASRRRRKKVQKGLSEKYAFLDIETTGLNSDRDSIIEIGVIYNDEEDNYIKWSTLIKIEGSVPKNITALTGINDKMLENDGINIVEALEQLNDIISQRIVVCYNSGFDLDFLNNSCMKNNIIFRTENIIDVLPLIRKNISWLENYKLGTVADYLDIEYEQQHRAIQDCEILRQVFLKVNEI